jgi:hypothetical protein
MKNVAAGLVLLGCAVTGCGRRGALEEERGRDQSHGLPDGGVNRDQDDEADDQGSGGYAQGSGGVGSVGAGGSPAPSGGSLGIGGLPAVGGAVSTGGSGGMGGSPTNPFPGCEPSVTSNSNYCDLRAYVLPHRQLLRRML